HPAQRLTHRRGADRLEAGIEGAAKAAVAGGPAAALRLSGLAKKNAAPPSQAARRVGRTTGRRADQKSMSAEAGAGAFSSLGSSATVASVVRIRPAMDAAFCSAVRVTLVGSTTPISTRSPYSPVATL